MMESPSLHQPAATDVPAIFSDLSTGLTSWVWRFSWMWFTTIWAPMGIISEFMQPTISLQNIFHLGDPVLILMAPLANMFAVTFWKTRCIGSTSFIWMGSDSMPRMPFMTTALNII